MIEKRVSTRSRVGGLLAPAGLVPAPVGLRVEVRVAEMREAHPRWGSRRIRLEMLRKPGTGDGDGGPGRTERTIDRILIRQGLLRARPRKKPKSAYRRFERPGPDAAVRYRRRRQHRARRHTHRGGPRGQAGDRGR